MANRGHDCQLASGTSCPDPWDSMCQIPDPRAKIPDPRSQIQDPRPRHEVERMADGLQLVVFISVLAINQSASSPRRRLTSSSHVALVLVVALEMASLRQVNLSPRDTFLPLRSVSFTLHAHKRRLTARQYFKINPTASDDEVWLTFQASRICLVPPILSDRRENKSIVNCGLPVSWVITQSLWSQGSPGRGRWLRIVYRHSSLLWHSEKLIARLMKHSIEQRSHNEISDIWYGHKLSRWLGVQR